MSIIIQKVLWTRKTWCRCSITPVLLPGMEFSFDQGAPSSDSESPERMILMKCKICRNHVSSLCHVVRNTDWVK
jgi:hypothetical protein